MGKDGRIHRKKEICNELGIGFLFVLHRTFITVRGNYWWDKLSIKYSAFLLSGK